VEKKDMDKNNNRLMSITEFCEYAGGIGRNTALKLAQEAGLRVKIGRRVLIDRVKFDQWVDQNM
jgi:excisionase family DNA binding protein